MSELPTYEGFLPALPATLMRILGVNPPSFIPDPIAPIVKKFGKKVDRIIFIMIDNLGLFEITYYKPQFLIEKADAIILLSTKNPYTLGVLHQLMFGGFEIDNNFHLLKALGGADLKTAMIGREKDISRYKRDSNTTAIDKETDMATWIEAAKVINRYDFSFIHFLDFEQLHRSKSRLRQDTPEELIEKLIKRTDKWLLSMYKQARAKSLLVILGNHGRYRLDLNYQGKIAQWRQASVPIGLMIYKE